MNGKIITVGSTKGGVGKTTLALNIAIARALAGRDVWLIDADRQGTASTALAIRGEAGKLPAIATAHYADGGQLRTQLLHQRGKFQDIVIDAGGRDSTALRAALVLSDLVLVPFQPRSIDVWAVADIAALIEEARAMRDGLPAPATRTPPPRWPTTRRSATWPRRSGAARASPTLPATACQCSSRRRATTRRSPS